MIISREHRYVFLQVPQTASSAIGRELRELYGGEKVGHKHGYLREARAILGTEVRSYVIGAGVRNPLDQVVSQYFKLKTTNPDGLDDVARIASRIDLSDPTRAARLRMIHDKELDFETYFMTFYRRPFGSGHRADQRRADVLIRFESVQEGFSRFLERVGLEVQRPLPSFHRTGSRSSDFAGYYGRPDVRAHTIHVFSPFMKDFSYEFPSDWHVPVRPGVANRLRYLALERYVDARQQLRLRHR